MIEATNTTELELIAVKGRVIELEQQLASMTNQRNQYVDMYNKVRNYIQGSIDREEWEASELEEIFWEELAELLDLTITETHEVTITTYWRATVRLPKGESIGELENYISVDDPELSHPRAELIEVDIRDTNISLY